MSQWVKIFNLKKKTPVTLTPTPAPKPTLALTLTLTLGEKPLTDSWFIES